MSDQNANLSREFIEQQRERLEALRKQLRGGEESRSASDRTFREEHGGEAREFEDAAQDLAQREIYQARHDVDGRRLADIDRALQKIAEGSYGLSDASGVPIPKARLEATPEAVLTVREEENKENGA